jgi:hypothetical protein
LAAYGDEITSPLKKRLGEIVKVVARKTPGLLLQSFRQSGGPAVR